MKTIGFTIMMLFVASIIFAENNKFEKVMIEQISLVYEASTVDEYQQVINTLERIGSAESNKWEPFYYASFANVMISTKVGQMSEKDRYLDIAQIFLDKANALNANNVEIITLQGFIHTMRLAADPGTRGQQYSELVFNTYNKALKIDPNNPRALIMLAQMKEGMARFFGSDTTEACEMANKALAAFDAYEIKNILSPAWGNSNAISMTERCNKLVEE